MKVDWIGQIIPAMVVGMAMGVLISIEVAMLFIVTGCGE